MATGKLKIIPLGGLNGIGKNMTVLEYDDDIIVIDCGIEFPDEELLGVDLVIPDITYLKKRKNKIRGFLITHGHEDHIGALPYVLKDISAPLFCTKLTGGIIGSRLAEHKMNDKVKIYEREAGDSFKLGVFGIEFIRVNHSVGNAVALAITTPVGVVIHTGDFKIDMTPVYGEMIDLARFGELGKNGVLALMSDSTNATRPGFSMSEKKVGEAIDQQFKNCDFRIIIASFSSNVDRIQQIINSAAKYNRKVAISGRSMENIVSVAIEQKYIKLPKDILISLEEINKYPKNRVVIVTTGSQGEPMSALHRMAYNSHKQVEISAGDKVIIAASPIPGNEKSVTKVVNELLKKGADVVYEKMAEVHASGHACQEELKMILSLVKPKFFMPVHGEFRHMKAHAALAKKVGMSPKNIFISDIGKILELTPNSARFTNTVPSGSVYVDGLGVGGIGNTVLSERKRLSEDGLVDITVVIDEEAENIIAGPEVLTKGFIYSKDSGEVTNHIRKVAIMAMEKCYRRNINDVTAMKSVVRDDVSGYIYKVTRKSPVVVATIIKI